MTLAPRRTRILRSNVCVPRKWATPTFLVGRGRTDVLCRKFHGGTTTHMREDEVRFDRAFQEIAESRMLQADVVREALCEALVSAYRKDTNASKAQRIEAEIDPKRGRPTIYVEKEVVDEIVSPHTDSGFGRRNVRICSKSTTRRPARSSRRRCKV
ncbi:MAG: hypothetical protein DCC53_00725 [Chloroflexi bacterium]|nr:MAG: hypothetical protein DCC53_00725 [Chloroflexota bacterium]